MSYACMGGTFDPFHRGHRALLKRAFEVADEVFIGVTDDEMAHARRERRVASVEDRVARLEAHLAELDLDKRAEVAVIHDAFGRALEPDFDMIVVSEETAPTADRINDARADAGVPPLLVEVVPYVLALDGFPIKGTRVANGEIDVDGFSPKRIAAAAGTQNPAKLDGIRRALERFADEVVVVGHDVDHGTAEQPYDDETLLGAVERARQALQASDECGLGIGVEAGIMRNSPGGSWLDVQFCAITDRQGRTTVGHGPGFSYPPAVLQRLAEDWSVGRAVGELTQRDDIGNAEGAIGYLTRGGADRAELTEWAVLAALVPRLRPELYGL